MKVLFLMESPEYLRFFDSAIEEMAARGHDVAIAVTSERTGKPVGLGGLQQYADRVRVLGMVPQHEGFWGATTQRLHAVMDFVRYFHPRLAAAPALRARIKRKVLPRAYHWLDLVPRLTPGAVRTIEHTLMACDRAIPPYQPMMDFLGEARPDVLLLSPLVDAASKQVDWVKAAGALGIRTAVCVASWDNLTNKGLLRIEPDLLIVWNDALKREATEYHYIPDEKIVTTGAQLFDRWFTTTAQRTRAGFCAHVGLPDTRPFLLFTGSSSFISESHAEAAFVRRWIQAVRASGDPQVREMNILVRPHPYNCHAWDPDPVGDLPGVAVFPRHGYNPIDADNRADFYDSIYHSAGVVGINTSAMIEAAIIGRPVFSMLADEFAGTQEGTVHFHHLVPENGGFVRIAASLDAHVRQLSDTCRDPEDARRETERFIASFVRPHGVNRPATPIFAEAVEKFAVSPQPQPRKTPLWAPAAWPLILATSGLAAFVDWARGRPFKPTRRALEKGTHRVRKTIGRSAAVGRERMKRRAKLAAKRWQKSVVKPLRARRS
jgi:hypothetical protein